LESCEKLFVYRLLITGFLVSWAPIFGQLIGILSANGRIYHCRSRSRIALQLRLRPKETAPCGSGSATLPETNRDLSLAHRIPLESWTPSVLILPLEHRIPINCPTIDAQENRYLALRIPINCPKINTQETRNPVMSNLYTYTYLISSTFL
jgi:hypothetical protein